jgi:hypothetical protein
MRKEGREGGGASREMILGATNQAHYPIQQVEADIPSVAKPSHRWSRESLPPSIVH